MKNVRFVALSLALAAGGLSSVACGGTTADANPQTSASALSKAPIGSATHGMVRVVGEALGEVSLRPEQRVELEKMAVEAEARHAGVLQSRTELMTTIADQIEHGTIDRAALQPKIDRVTAEMEKVRPEDQAAFLRVHALLDADQRNAFVDALHDHGKGKRGGHFEKMKELADELKLTDDQRSQIKDVMKAGRKEHEAHEGHAAEGKEHFKASKAAMDSFRTEKFEPSGLDHAAKISEGATRFIGFAERVLPILTPEQRKIAADKVRARAASGDAESLMH